MALHTDTCPGYELRFDPLTVSGRALSFPCSDKGEVDLNTLGERARHNYFFARAVVGREFGWPAVRRIDLH